MKNVCIVGYGAIGPIHAAAVEKTHNAKVYAVCDINPEKIKICKSNYDVVAYTDFDKMLLDKNIDSVHICTPHHLHFEMTKKAIRAGKSVVCEKPLTMTQPEFKKLSELENSNKICAVLQNRLNPCIKKLKLIADSGELGEIKSLKGFLTWSRTKEYYEREPWRGSWETEGGGVLINQAVHTLDYFSYIGGNITSVKANIMNYSLPEIQVEDTCVAHMNFENGATGVFFATNAYGRNSAPDLEIVFEKGIARYTNTKLYINEDLTEEDLKPSLGKDYWGKGHEKLMENYYDYNKFFSPCDVKGTMDTLFAIYQSAKQDGKEISI